MPYLEKASALYKKAISDLTGVQTFDLSFDLDK